jgi:hypothetical protein
MPAFDAFRDTLLPLASLSASAASVAPMSIAERSSALASCGCTHPRASGARDGINLLPGRERKSLHVLERLLILQTDLVDQLCVDNDALL